MFRQNATAGVRRIGRGLKNWLALLEARHPSTIELGLERCGEVYRNLNSPRPAATVFTVAGTNGKGSTVAYLAAINAGLGRRCGTYTSPHILNFNERITTLGKPASDACLIHAFEQVEAARGQISLTYFEFTTLAAFLILHQAALDCAVLEVGLGGRLDAVNLVDADCAVITPIGLDHQDFLGPDLASIATEKAGIIRAGAPLVCTQTQPPEPVLQAAANLRAPLYRRGMEFDLVASDENQLHFSLAGLAMSVPAPRMGGRHQLDNLAAALAATALLYPDCVENPGGIAHAIGDCRLPGRLQQIASGPDIIVDVGHNALAAEAVAVYFGEKRKADVICVLGMLADKPAESVVRALDGVCARWLCVDSPGERGQRGELLASRVKEALPAVEVSVARSVEAALDTALTLAGKEGTILVFGSFATASGALTWMAH